MLGYLDPAKRRNKTFTRHWSQRPRAMLVPFSYSFHNLNSSLGVRSLFLRLISHEKNFSCDLSFTINTKMVSGIDCSKDYFDVAVLRDGKIVFTGRFDNNILGFEQVLVHVQESHAAMEATGPYYFQLARFLYEHQVKVSVVNPLSVRRFSQMRMSRAKTDSKDALLIAEFTMMTAPREWILPDQQIVDIRNLETYMEGVKKRYGILFNQLHAFLASGTIKASFEQQIQSELQAYQQCIKDAEKEIEHLIAKNYHDLSKNLRSIPGIGPRSVSLLITLTGGFDLFKSHKQVISYFGLAPRIYESGSSVKGKSHICKMGMGNVRKVLYMAATSAIRCNKACKDLYDRLRAKGKPHKVALIAAVNKLIKQAFAIAKSGKPYFVPTWRQGNDSLA